MKKSILFCLGLLFLAPAWGGPQNEIQDAAQERYQEQYQETDQAIDQEQYLGLDFG